MILKYGKYEEFTAPISLISCIIEIKVVFYESYKR